MIMIIMAGEIRDVQLYNSSEEFSIPSTRIFINLPRVFYQRESLVYERIRH